MVHNETLDNAVENFDKLTNVTQSALRLMGVRPDQVVVSAEGKIIQLCVCPFEESDLTDSDWGKLSRKLVRKLGETMRKDFNAQWGANPMSGGFDYADWFAGWLRK